MSSRIRDFLDPEGTHSAGRWFVAVLAVGFLAMTYVVSVNWSSNTTWQRVKGIAGLVLIVGFAIPYARSRGQKPPSETGDPTA